MNPRKKLKMLLYATNKAKTVKHNTTAIALTVGLSNLNTIFFLFNYFIKISTKSLKS